LLIHAHADTQTAHTQTHSWDHITLSMHNMRYLTSFYRTW